MPNIRHFPCHTIDGIAVPGANLDFTAQGGIVITADQATGTIDFDTSAVGGGNTLDAAYDQGGAGAGREINVDSGAVLLDQIQTSGTTLEISAQAGITQAGAVTGQLIDLDTNFTNAGSDAVIGLHIILNSNVLSGNARGIFVQSKLGSSIAYAMEIECNLGGNHRGLHIDQNTQQIAFHVDSAAQTANVCLINVANDSGTMVLVQYDSVNTTLGALVGLDLDLTTNVTAGGFAHTGLRVLIPATTAAAAVTTAAIQVDSDATLQNVIQCRVRNTGASNGIWALSYAGATIAGAQVIGFAMNFTSLTQGAQQLLGCFVSGLNSTATTSAGYFGQSVAGYRGAVYEVDARQTACAVGLIRVRHGGSTTLAAAMIGQDIDLATNSIPGAFAVTGLRILIPATTRAETAGEAAIFVDSQATLARSLDIAVANTAGSGGILLLRWRAATTATTNCTGLAVDYTNLDSAANIIRGVMVLAPDSTNETAQAGSSMFIAQAGDGGYRGVSFLAQGRQTQATLGLFRGEALASGPTLVGPFRGMVLDLSTSVISGASEVTGLRILIPATTRANTAGEGALVVSSDAITQRLLDLEASNTSGIVSAIRWKAGSGSLTSQVQGLAIDLNTNVTHNNRVLTCLSLSTGQTGVGNVASSAVLNIASNGSAQRVIDVAHRNVNTGTTGIMVFRHNAATAVNAAVRVIDIDGVTSVTPGAFAYTGLRMTIPATTVADAAGEGALVIDSQATRSRAIDLAFAAGESGSTSGVVHARIRAALTLTSTLNAFYTDLNTNLNSTSEAVRGYVVDMGATTPATSAGFFAYIPASTYTGRGAWISTEQTAHGAGSAGFVFEYADSTTLSGASVGAILDLATNVTPGAQPVTGLRILIPATTAADTAGEGAIVIDSQATDARALDIAVANDIGTIAEMRYRGATTQTGVIHGLVINLATNFTNNGSQVQGLEVSGNAGAYPDANNGGFVHISCSSQQQRVLDISVRNDLGKAIVVRQASSNTILGSLYGMIIDWATNVTPGANETIGHVVQLPDQDAADRAIALRMESVNVSRLELQQQHESITFAGGSTASSTITFPADSMGASATVRVTTDITGCTTVGIGVSGDTARYTPNAGNLAVAAGSTAAVARADNYGAATAILFSAVGGGPPDLTTGVVRLTISYWKATAPTS